MDHPSPEPRIHAHHHSVKFYGNEDSLFTTVGSFLSEGLIARQPAIVIATEPHREAIVQELSNRLIDVDEATSSGCLVLLDARDTLDTFMVGEAPDPKQFEVTVGGLIDDTLKRCPGMVLRAYGEMVDILWKDGRPEAAIKLEILWNDLARIHGFALLCGYSMGNFYKQAAQFQGVCQQHTHVLDTDSNVVVFDPRRARTA